jgi:NAD dependent epimerase/dehydratase family enzyme
LFRVPAVALRVALGEMADETLLASQRAVPERLLEVGFRFRDPTAGEGLRRLLHR